LAGPNDTARAKSTGRSPIACGPEAVGNNGCGWEIGAAARIPLIANAMAGQ